MTDEAAFDKMQLQRMILMALQRFEAKHPGVVVREVQLMQGDVQYADKIQHALTKVTLVTEEQQQP